MAITTTERTIDGREIKVVTLDGRRAILLKTRLVKLLGPALRQLFPQIQSLLKVFNDPKLKTAEQAQKAIENGEIALDKEKLSVVKSKLLDGEIDFTPAITAFAEMLEHLEPEDMLSLAEQMTRGVFIDGRDLSKDTVFNDVFAGDMMLLYKVLFLVVEVNFGSFFAGLGIGSRQPS